MGVIVRPFEQIKAIGNISNLACCTFSGNSEANYKIYLKNTMDDTIENVTLPTTSSQMTW